MDDYISKPIEPDKMIQVLRRYLPGEKVSDMTPVAEQAEVRAYVKKEIETPVLDIDQAMRVTGGKQTMFRRIAAVFLQHMPNRMDELLEAVTQEDCAEVARLSHSIHGASASLGGKRLCEVARRLEEMARAEGCTDAAKLADAVAREFEELRAALEAIEWERI